MDEIIEDETGRIAAVFDDRIGNNTVLAADIAAIMGDDDTIDDMEFVEDIGPPEIEPLVQVVDDSTAGDFDVIEAIRDAPPEFVADNEIAEAFESILQSNGVDDDEIEEILALDVNAAALNTAVEDEAVPTALTTTDITDQIDEGPTTALDNFVDDDNADVAIDPELLANSQMDVGVEAQSGVLTDDTDAAADTAGMDACPMMGDMSDDTATGDMMTVDVADMDAETPADDASAGDDTAIDSSDGDVVMTADDAAVTTTDSDPAADMMADGCDLDSVDWTTPGANGLSALGEVVQAIQELIDQTGDLFARLEDSPCFSPCDAAADALANDMADLMQMDALADADLGGTDDDMMG
ncbi:hypothetical protein ACFQ14_15375 [Pseudahrensia aquimaris]|uniref:Uncharacterized protein n=1 Tax=Pseudahrensia aquimaris TaxID=744461 RepID=A0ABW3FH28_9HYPH